MFNRFRRDPRIVPVQPFPIIGYIEGIPIRSEEITVLPSGRFENLRQAQEDLNTINNIWIEYLEADERFQASPMMIDRIIQLLNQRHSNLQEEIRRRREGGTINRSTPLHTPPAA